MAKYLNMDGLIKYDELIKAYIDGKVGANFTEDDKNNLDTLVALLASDDSDVVVNTIQEVLNIFNEYPEGADLVSALSDKVDKVEGKGLSSNDYTTTEKDKLAGIATGANKTTVNNTLTSSSTTEALSAAQGKALNDKFGSYLPKTGGTLTGPLILGTASSPTSIKGNSGNSILIMESGYVTVGDSGNSLALAGKDLRPRYEGDEIALLNDVPVIESSIIEGSANGVQNGAVYTALEGKSDTNHTHDYAGSVSGSGGIATGATKLYNEAGTHVLGKGSATQPVYFSGGVPVATTYTLSASVPANAKFTDTITTVLDSVTSTSGTSALSANMGKFIYDEVKAIVAQNYTSDSAITTAEIEALFPSASE